MSTPSRYPMHISEREVAHGFNVVMLASGMMVVERRLGRSLYAVKVRLADKSFAYIVCNRDLEEQRPQAKTLEELERRYPRAKRIKAHAPPRTRKAPRPSGKRAS
jgi:hypothetical protein